MKRMFSVKIGVCTISLTLDTRHSIDKHPLSMRYCINRRCYYYPLGEYMTVAEFNDVMAYETGKGRPTESTRTLRAVKEKWQCMFEGYAERLRQLSESTLLSLDTIRANLTGRAADKSFLSIWSNIIQEKIDSGKPKTASQYQTACNSFVEVTHLTDGFSVTVEVIKKWESALMERGCSRATIEAYKRICRIVVNRCIDMGYIQKSNYPFGNRDNNKVKIHIPRSRREAVLSVDRWGEIYDIWQNKDYPDKWSDQYKQSSETYIGLFLLSYLMNGLNLMDLLYIRYDSYYVQTNKQAFRFVRHKTKDTADNESEVVVPIIEPVRVILERIASKYKADRLLFGYLVNNAADAKKTADRVAQINQTVKKHIRRLFKDKGWPESPSPIWARHSFATNLKHQGIDELYVSFAMGHSRKQSVTMGYINDYSIDMMKEINNKLLPGGQRPKDMSNFVANLTDEQKHELLKLLQK